MNEEKIISVISKGKWMMEILKSVKSLKLPDWWICAGFVRSKVWDTLHDFSERTPIPDIDVIYFEPNNIDGLEEKKLEEKLKSLIPYIPWSVKNEARMHIKSNMSPYSSSVDAISKFPETATALGVKLDEKDNVILIAPCGISDIVNLEVKPTPFFTETKERVEIYEGRISKKNWKSTWSKLKVNHINSSY
ncbi:nucleotidyltransferase family protein [Peribacillus frigoritolerans]|uniref:nucleotidyltransferase family protein n=1 Tax=Peribacillus frigoritolerans TaxID=450367 RepID=UPI00203D1855|nr:nucleotidyltransferase family protein [Peribacillus frigoritolerans]MCM3170506.1 nucleotidyltransferase family protein [Peribacillus frigoritolerans]